MILLHLTVPDIPNPEIICFTFQRIDLQFSARDGEGNHTVV